VLRSIECCSVTIIKKLSSFVAFSCTSLQKQSQMGKPHLVCILNVHMLIHTKCTGDGKHNFWPWNFLTEPNCVQCLLWYEAFWYELGKVQIIYYKATSAINEDFRSLSWQIWRYSIFTCHQIMRFMIHLNRPSIKTMRGAALILTYDAGVSRWRCRT
jgi:hypothetical protein